MLFRELQAGSLNRVKILFGVSSRDSLKGTLREETRKLSEPISSFEFHANFPWCIVSPKKKDPNKSPLKNQCLEDESFPYAAPAYIFQGTSCSSSVVYTSQKPYSLIYPRRPDPNIFQPSIFQRSALGFQEGVAITNL